nr:type IV pilus modification protein PilV [Desulfobotulus pelophilus]
MKQDGRQESGFTLIEVLIVMVIISIGLLALAALQNRTLKDNHSALLRSRAVQHSEDILDRIRANRDNMASYALGLTKDAPAGDLIHQVDLREWINGLTGSLAGGRGAVLVSGGVVTVTVEWREGVRGDGEAGEAAEGDGTVFRQISMATRP